MLSINCRTTCPKPSGGSSRPLVMAVQNAAVGDVSTRTAIRWSAALSGLAGSITCMLCARPTSASFCRLWISAVGAPVRQQHAPQHLRSARVGLRDARREEAR